ncbi:DedA family protein [Paenibacillus sp. CC-CFT747]|nr:DedA family protein [Paenibacillus sp. CC-CFT747]
MDRPALRDSLLEKYGARIGLTEEKLRRTEKWFTRFGRYAVTLSYFIPGVRHLSAYSAGISGWPYRTFLAYAAPGGLVWAFVFVTLGRMAGRSWLTFSHTMHHYLLYIGYGAAAAALVGWRLYKRRREEA